MPGLMSRASTVVKAKFSKLLDRAEDPNETLDYSYEKQLQLLQNVKRGVADVVTSKKRLQLQTQQLEQSVVTGAPMLAHKASHEGVICVEAIKGLKPHAMEKNKIPGCTYCHPQIASVGLTEKKAKELGRDVRVGRFPFVGNGKAIALGEPEGLVKTIFDKKTGELLGAHMVGAEVTELIQGFVVAMNCETTEAELMQSVFPHPTISETMHESVLDAYGRVIHV